jgi:hypothetical protein
MDRTSSETSEVRDFREAASVEVSKTCHSFVNNSVQILLFYIFGGPINDVLGFAMIGHLVGALKSERFAGRSASYR